MWLRTAEISRSESHLEIRHGALSGPECRLRAALLQGLTWPGGPGRTSAALSGVAWQDREGRTHWGWPDPEGRVVLRSGAGRPEECCLLPAALSLAMALRRSRCDLGALALVIGDGFGARLARAVSSAVGCRIVASENGPSGGAGPRPSVVLETTGMPGHLIEAVRRCADWGFVLSLGGALASGPFDYYEHVHRRALTLVDLAARPVLDREEEEIVDRGSAYLIEVLTGLRPDPDEVLDVLVQPEGTRGRLGIERSGWGLLRVGDD